MPSLLISIGVECVMVLVENGAIVYPAQYVGAPLENVEYIVNSKAALDATLALEGSITISSDIQYSTLGSDGKSDNAKIKINGAEKTITVAEGKTLTAGGENGAILAMNGAKVTLDGKGTIKADLGTSGRSMAVWAYNGAVVKITDGYYTNETDGSARGSDLIYANKNSRVEISGGIFKAATPQWTLNCSDNADDNSVIIVSGGMFYMFNPAENSVGEGEVVVADGYSVVRCDENGTESDTGDWYKVVKA